MADNLDDLKALLTRLKVAPHQFPTAVSPGGSKYRLVPVTCRVNPLGRPEVIGYSLYPDNKFDPVLHASASGDVAQPNESTWRIKQELLDMANQAERQARKLEAENATSDTYVVGGRLVVNGHPWASIEELRDAVRDIKPIRVALVQGYATLALDPSTVALAKP